MDLVYIYGPPGVGKFTVGSELSRLTGYRLFHNQLSIEFVRSVFDFGSLPFNRLVLRFRAEMLEEAARNGVSVIFTSAYAKGLNDGIVKDIIRKVKKYDGRICLVQLYCDRKVLLRRVKGKSRHGFFKIRSSSQLDTLLKRYNHFSAMPFGKNLRIDNTQMPPDKAAALIMSHYGLRRKPAKV